MNQPTDTSAVETQQSVDVGLDSEAQAQEFSQREVVKEQAEPKSGLEAVKAALSEQEQSEQPEQQSDSTIRAEKEGEAEAKEGEQSSDIAEPANLSPKARENWKRLQADRDQWMSKAKQSEPLAEKAKAYDQITGMVQRTGLDAQELDSAVSIAALVKRDPAAALKELTGVVDSLRRIVGDVLPADIQALVDDGSMTETAAKQFARSRYEADHARLDATRITEQQRNREAQQQADAEQQAQSQLIEQTGSVLTKWENSWKAADPDFSIKQPLVRARVVELVQERGKPRSIEDAVKLANDAKTDIDNQLRGAFQRNRQPMRTVTGGEVNGIVPAKPKTALEAARAALGLG